MSSERFKNPHRGDRQGTMQPVHESDLLDLFERRRPNKDAFRDRIRQRISERTSEPTSEREAEEDSVRTVGSKGPRGAEPQEPSSPWQRAAAFLPIPTTTSKLIPAALAWPFFLLLACFGGFFLGQRSLANKIGNPGTANVAPRRKGRKLNYGHVGGAIQFALLGALMSGGVWVLDAVLVVILLAMFAFVWMVGRMAEAGNASRPEVAGLASGVLISILVGGSLWTGTSLGGAELAAANVSWTFFPLIIGVVITTFLAGRRIAVVALSVWAIFALVMLNPLGATETSPGSLRRQLEHYELEVDDLGQWAEAGALYQALEAVGEKAPDLDSVKQKVIAATRSPKDVHPVVWEAAAAMGMLGQDEWERLAAYHSKELDRLVESAQSGRGAARISRTGYNQYRVTALLKTRSLDEPTLDSLAQMVLANWPISDEHGALERANDCVRLLEQLGREDLISDKHDAIESLLAECWIGRTRSFGFANTGGFTPNPVKFQTSFDDPTLAAVELMARVGVPDSIDPFLVHGYLRHGSRRSEPLALMDNFAYLRGIERAALIRLEGEVGLPARSWLEKLVNQRIMVMVLLVIALCLLAIRMTPADPAANGGGAQP